MKRLSTIFAARRYWRMAHDPRTPAAARVVLYGGILYAFSPIDLIPDWIPILGQLDDAVVLPVILATAAALIPKEVRDSENRRLEREVDELPAR